MSVQRRSKGKSKGKLTGKRRANVNKKGRSLLMRLQTESYAHVRLVFQDGHTMEFLSPVECEKTGRTWLDKVNVICGSRPALKRLVKFHKQDTPYDTLGFHNTKEVREF
jgi:hypothetical protein